MHQGSGNCRLLLLQGLRLTTYNIKPDKFLRQLFHCSAVHQSERNKIYSYLNFPRPPKLKLWQKYWIQKLPEHNRYMCSNDGSTDKSGPSGEKKQDERQTVVKGKPTT